MSAERACRGVRVLAIGVGLALLASNCGTSGQQTAAFVLPDDAGSPDAADAAPSDASDVSRDARVLRGQADAISIRRSDAAMEDAGCAAEALAACDDQNVCTLDLVDETCRCIHDPLPDGSECNDGDICTQGDECRSGSCSGRGDQSSPKILGSLKSFGALSGAVSFVASNRLVLAAGRTLTLVGLNAGELQLLDQADYEPYAGYYQIGPMVWVNRPGTFVIPLSNKRFVVAEYMWGMDVYDRTGDRLTALSHYKFAAEIYAATGAGDRVWTCAGGSRIRSFNVTQASEVKEAQSVFLPAGHACRGLSVSADAKTLVVASSGGLDLVDISKADGSMTLARSALDGEYLLAAESNEHAVVAYKLGGTRQADGTYFASGAYGEVQVLSRDTLLPIASFPMNVAATTPIGFSIVGRDLVLLEQSTTSTGCRLLSAKLHSVSPEAVSLRSSWTYSEKCGDQGAFANNLPILTANSQAHVVLEPTHRVLSVDPDTGVLTPLTGLQQGSFERVRAGTRNSVDVYSQLSTQRIDITHPETPVVTSGGLLAPVGAEPRLLISTDGQSSFLTVTDEYQRISGPTTSLYWADPNGGFPVRAGSIANENSESEWVASGKYLYELSPKDVADYRIRSFPTTALSREDDQKLSPITDEALATQAPADLPRRKRTWFRVDPTTQELVVLEARTSLNLSVQTAAVSWFTKNKDHYVSKFSLGSLGAGAVGLELAQGRAVVAFVDHVSVVDRSGVKGAAFTLDSTLVSIDNLLEATPRFVYLAVTFQGTPRTKGVLVLRASDLSEVSRYPTPEPVLSVAEVGDHLVFGMKSTLSTASPACSP